MPNIIKSSKAYIIYSKEFTYFNISTTYKKNEKANTKNNVKNIPVYNDNVTVSSNQSEIFWKCWEEKEANGKGAEESLGKHAALLPKTLTRFLHHQRQWATVRNQL